MKNFVLKNKYGNQKYLAFGRWFDSKKEGVRYIELKTLQMGGEISELQCQKVFWLIANRYYGGVYVRGCKYIADFYYYDKTLKSYVAEDVKGFPTEVYKLKKKLFLEKYVMNGNLIFLENGEKQIYYKKNEKN